MLKIEKLLNFLNVFLITIVFAIYSLLYCSKKGEGYGSLEDYIFSCVDCLPSHKLSHGLPRWKW